MARRRPSAEASGGEPRSTQEPSTRRTSSPRSASSPRAVETVGRRAPTSWPRIRWVSASGTTTPSPDTRPQRSARCQSRALSRRSTRVSCEIACVVPRRSERSLRRSKRAAVTSGQRASSPAKRRSSTAKDEGERIDHSTSTGSRSALLASCHGRTRSPGAEQLGADVVGDDHLARDHAVEQQQADVVGARALEARDVPDADAELVDAHDELALGLLAARAGEQAAEVGVGLEQADGVGGGCLDHGLRRRFLDLRTARRIASTRCLTRRSRKEGDPSGKSPVSPRSPRGRPCGGSARRRCRRGPRTAACRARSRRWRSRRRSSASRRRSAGAAGWRVRPRCTRTRR